MLNNSYLTRSENDESLLNEQYKYPKTDAEHRRYDVKHQIRRIRVDVIEGHVVERERDDKADL